MIRVSSLQRFLKAAAFAERVTEIEELIHCIVYLFWLLFSSIRSSQLAGFHRFIGLCPVACFQMSWQSQRTRTGQENFPDTFLTKCSLHFAEESANFMQKLIGSVRVKQATRREARDSFGARVGGPVAVTFVTYEWLIWRDGNYDDRRKIFVG